MIFMEHLIARNIFPKTLFRKFIMHTISLSTCALSSIILPPKLMFHHRLKGFLLLREKARGANEFINILPDASLGLFFVYWTSDVTLLLVLPRRSFLHLPELRLDFIERLLIILLRSPFRRHAPRNLRTLEILISQFPLNRYGTLFVGTSLNCRD